MSGSSPAMRPLGSNICVLRPRYGLHHLSVGLAGCNQTAAATDVASTRRGFSNAAGLSGSVGSGGWQNETCR
eukprot:CAMPEP_0181201130 /NCGR_PEP_ID=MMETSP1096-20121128/18142_1 /TAXON_ID=156174 ORGANISM="Chrysochromulina ericina, Strain CCMP281" /NCGR_SAMPLE_ID=MMETSP1096 /ASSEMBLY_ACC=CAM_ASM_000453 /LENGTH=71 /DNA_ID=CAMNT_0023291551 /DNA_START=616 /DNA_END=832 /DNA_ORIENTATION=+